MSLFTKLFEPIMLRKSVLKNRLVASPVTTNYASESGEVTERLLNYYKMRAEGGVSLVIVEGSFVHPAAKGYVRQIGIHEDALLPSLKRLADIIHEGGAKASIQIQHTGRRTSYKISGCRPKAPSPIPCYSGGEVPQEMSIEDIQEAVDAHVKASLRAKRAGFDFVDIHAAHGYLIPAFFSPLSNKRSDEYGGTLEKRFRFANEIIKGMRDALGDDFPITIKISGDEFVHGGLSLVDMMQIARLLERAGVDAITVSAGTVVPDEGQLDSSQPHKFVRTLPMGTKPGCFAYLAGGIKGSIGIPVMAVGRINTPFIAEEILLKEQADLVCLGRALLCDPLFPKKALEGRPESIRTCIACNQGCFDRLFLQKDISCMINPTVGREEEMTPRKSPRNRKVWVIGGGPAGMEAARVAASRGCKVTLFDDQNELGGQLRLAGIPPDRGEFRHYIEYQLRMLQSAGIEIKSNFRVNREGILEGKPDTVIFATGSKTKKPPIDGTTSDQVKNAGDVLRSGRIRESQVIVVGGGLVGCETAEFLASKQNQVVLIEMLQEIAVDAIGDNKKFLSAKLRKLGVEIRLNTAVRRITHEGVICSTSKGDILVPGKIIVLALGSMPNREVLDTLDIRDDRLEMEGKITKILQAGDCVEVRNALEAISEGFRAGLEA